MEDSTNCCCQKQCHNFLLSSQIHCKYYGRVAFTIFKQHDIKGVRQPLTRTASLEDRYCEVTIPIVKGHHNGQSAWNGSHLEHISAFYMEITNIHGVKWKMSCFNHIKIDLSGFVVTMHLGLCKQYFKSFSLSASGFDFLFCTHPRALWQQSTPEPVLIP